VLDFRLVGVNLRMKPGGVVLILAGFDDLRSEILKRKPRGTRQKAESRKRKAESRKHKAQSRKHH
jgi:hypothetical protein